MKTLRFACPAIALTLSAGVLVAGCNNLKPLVVGPHTLGEPVAQFNAIEHSTGVPEFANAVYSGTIHCYETKTLSDNCQGSRDIDGKPYFDNAHYTFVQGRLKAIELVGAGGIIGDKHQNWNWNLYLTWLTTKYGKPTEATENSAKWSEGDNEVVAYLKVNPPMFPQYDSRGVQDEHVVFLTKDFADQLHIPK
jgi:hypothetical protein